MSLGLVMIARDAAVDIGRALNSVRTHVDDLLVLDTGSVDGTIELARAAGARVEHFTWIDDFSAARNAALALSPTDWHLVLDADEWLTQGADALRAAAAQPPDFIGLLCVDSSFDADGTVRNSPSWLPRLLPRGTRYAGRIHEQPQGAWPRRRLPVHLGHDGYRDDALRRKDGRNRALLQRALADAPHDAYLLYQLGKDHDVQGRYAEAAAPYDQALARAPREAGWRHDLVVRAIFTLKRLGRHADGLALAQREMPQWAESPDFFFALGDLLLDWAAEQPDRAGELLPMIDTCWRECLRIGERPELEGSVPGRGSHLAAHNLALLQAHFPGAVSASA